MVNGLHLYSAFLTSGHSKRFTILSNIHPFMHTFTHRQRRQPRKATASSSGAVKLRCLAQGHLDTLGGAGDRTSNLPVTNPPALPPELNVCIRKTSINNFFKNVFGWIVFQCNLVLILYLIVLHIVHCTWLIVVSFPISIVTSNKMSLLSRVPMNK